MNIQRKSLFIIFWLLLSLNFSCCSSEENTETLPKHENFPRWIKIFSRSGDEDSEKEEGLLKHIVNVFKGGSIGIEAETRPLKGVNKFFEKVKGMFSNRGIFGMKKRKRAYDEPDYPFPPGFGDPRLGTDDETSAETGETFIQPRIRGKYIFI